MELSPAAASPESAHLPADASARLVWPRRLSAAWLLVWSGLSLWAAYGLATAWPYELHPLLLVLLVSMSGLVFRAGDILFMQRRGRRLAGWWRAAGRLAALPLGVVLAFLLFSKLEPISMASFEGEIATWVRQMHVSAPTSCPADGKYAVDAALNSYLERSGAIRGGTLHHGDGRFVLELKGRSIDIDGSTLYYDSVTRKWNRFHNDNRERAGEFQALINTLAECRFVLR